MWKEWVAGGYVIFDGKSRRIDEMNAWVHGQLPIPLNPSILDCSSHEAKIGNLLLKVDSQVALAEYAVKNLGTWKKQYLVLGRDKKKTKDMVEAELFAENEDFKMLCMRHQSAENNYTFWKNSRTACLDALDRLRQISIALSAEMKKNNTSQY